MFWAEGRGPSDRQTPSLPLYFGFLCRVLDLPVAVFASSLHQSEQVAECLISSAPSDATPPGGGGTLNHTDSLMTPSSWSSLNSTFHIFIKLAEKLKANT